MRQAAAVLHLWGCCKVLGILPCRYFPLSLVLLLDCSCTASKEVHMNDEKQIETHMM